MRKARSLLTAVVLPAALLTPAPARADHEEDDMSGFVVLAIALLAAEATAGLVGLIGAIGCAAELGADGRPDTGWFVTGYVGGALNLTASPVIAIEADVFRAIGTAHIILGVSATGLAIAANVKAVQHDDEEQRRALELLKKRSAPQPRAPAEPPEPAGPPPPSVPEPPGSPWMPAPAPPPPQGMLPLPLPLALRDVTGALVPALGWRGSF